MTEEVSKDNKLGSRPFVQHFLTKSSFATLLVRIATICHKFCQDILNLYDSLTTVDGYLVLCHLVVSLNWFIYIKPIARA